MASIAVLLSVALVALALMRISRARRRRRPVGWMPVLLLGFAVALIVFVAVVPLVAER